MIAVLLNLLTGALIALAVPHFVVAVCILFFRVTGLLSDGPMFFDMETPTYRALLLFMGISGSVIAACFLVRRKFLNKPAAA